MSKLFFIQQLFFQLLAIIFLACDQKQEEFTQLSFEGDIESLKAYFHIPGLAVIVTKNNENIYENYFGYADLKTKRPIDSATLFPIASITKTFATVLVMQLVESGKLSLAEPVNKYLDHSTVSDSVKIRHILSHTSEGEPGSFFNYSSRFSLLTEVLEKVSGMPLDQLMKREILQKQSLQNTFPITDQFVLDSMADRMAKPYYYNGKVEDGHYDVGLSTASGLLSNVRDIAKFDKSLSNGEMVSKSSAAKMFVPYNTTIGKSPYGLGIFSHEFLGKKLIWGYGQEDCFSSLLLKVPEDNLTLILLANNNLMSDPARLINGDLTYSLFALSFLKHFVFELPRIFKTEDWSNPSKINFEFPEDEFAAFYRQEVLANALAASFMGFGNSTEFKRSKVLTELTFKYYPDYTAYGNQSLMHLLGVLTTYAHFDEFNEHLEKLGDKLIMAYDFDPYANIYMASYFKELGMEEQALVYFKRIVESQNFGIAWYTLEALDFLGDYYKSKNPKLARTYFQRVVDIGWNMGGKIDKAKTELLEP